MERTDFFDGIELASLPQIVRIAEMNRPYARNSYIYRQGDSVDSVYVLVEGRIRLSRLSESGKNIVFLIASAPCIFGEADVLGNEFYSNDAQAHDECVVSSIKKADFIELLQLYPALLVRLHKILAERWKEAQEQIEILGTLSVRDRVATILRRYAQIGGQAVDESWVRLNLNQQDISELAGATRESVNKTFHELKSEQAIRLQGHLIEVSHRFIYTDG